MTHRILLYFFGVHSSDCGSCWFDLILVVLINDMFLSIVLRLLFHHMNLFRYLSTISWLIHNFCTLVKKGSYWGALRSEAFQQSLFLTFIVSLLKKLSPLIGVVLLFIDDNVQLHNIDPLNPFPVVICSHIYEIFTWLCYSLFFFLIWDFTLLENLYFSFSRKRFCNRIIPNQ